MDCRPGMALLVLALAVLLCAPSANACNLQICNGLRFNFRYSIAPCRRAFSPPPYAWGPFQTLAPGQCRNYGNRPVSIRFDYTPTNDVTFRTYDLRACTTNTFRQVGGGNYDLLITRNGWMSGSRRACQAYSTWMRLVNYGLGNTQCGDDSEQRTLDFGRFEAFVKLGSDEERPVVTSAWEQAHNGQVLQLSIRPASRGGGDGDDQGLPLPESMARTRPTPRPSGGRKLAQQGDDGDMDPDMTPEPRALEINSLTGDAVWREINSNGQPGTTCYQGSFELTLGECTSSGFECRRVPGFPRGTFVTQASLSITCPINIQKLGTDRRVSCPR